MKAPPRSVAVTVLVFAGFGLTCGLIGAAVLRWYYSQPFTIYTASYQQMTSDRYGSTRSRFTDS